jgi:2-alkyl-3-oxoalkanoate reductase
VTRRLLSAAQAQNVRSFVFASTPSIYTDMRAQINITEGTTLPSKFANDYAETKYAAEQLVLAHEGTMRTIALRPRAIVSPFDTALLPRLIRASERGLMPLPGKGRALIELTDARDVVAAFLAAAKRSSALHGQVFNISGGAPRRFEELVTYVFAKLNRNVCQIPLNARLVTMLGGMMEGIANLLPGRPEPPLTRYSAMALGWSQTFDLSAAREALGWEPQYTPEQAIDWALGGNTGG